MASLLMLAALLSMLACSGGGGGGSSGGQGPGGPAPAPTNILTVGPGRQFGSIAAAIAQVDPDHDTILVDPGVYGPFTVDAQSDPAFKLRIIGTGAGTVTVDATATPVEVNNLVLFNDVELSDLVITSSSTTHPSLLVHHSRPSVLLLDELQITGGPGQPAVSIEESWRIAFQRSVISGPPGMQITGYSIVTATMTQVDRMEVRDTSLVRGIELGVSDLVVDPTATYTLFPGLQPDLNNTEVVQLDTVTSLFLTGNPGNQWFIGLAPSLDWYEVPQGGFFPLVGLIDAFNTVVVASGTYDGAGLAQLPVQIPNDPSIVGVPLIFQGLQYDPALNDYRWTTVTCMLPLP